MIWRKSNEAGEAAGSAVASIRVVVFRIAEGAQPASTDRDYTAFCKSLTGKNIKVGKILAASLCRTERQFLQALAGDFIRAGIQKGRTNFRTHLEMAGPNGRAKPHQDISASIGKSCKSLLQDAGGQPSPAGMGNGDALPRARSEEHGKAVCRQNR